MRLSQWLINWNNSEFSSSSTSKPPICQHFQGAWECWRSTGILNSFRHIHLADWLITRFYEDMPFIYLVLSAVMASHTPVLPERNTPQESQPGLNSRVSRRKSLPQTIMLLWPAETAGAQMRKIICIQRLILFPGHPDSNDHTKNYINYSTV